ncbi:MAG: hypothetical protein ABH869_06890 [Candidatus Omnitrophota bacterium]
MKKSDMDKFYKKYEPAVKKTGAQLAKVLKTAESDISKMYKIAHTHVELQMKNLQKEKLYHELGKYVAESLMKGDFTVDSLDKYKKKLTSLNSAGDKMKKKLSRISKARKKKSEKAQT